MWQKCVPYTLSYKNKLFKNSKSEIGKNIKANWEHFEAGKFKNKKPKIKLIYTFFQNLIEKWNLRGNEESGSTCSVFHLSDF